MNDTSHEVPAGPIDCNALKALLSPYLDDELTRDERLRADAHLVACGGCRTLVERAEALDEELRAKFADDLADADAEFAANPIDIAAFQARVLEAIGHELDLTRERVRQLEAQALARLSALRDMISVAAA